MSDLLSRIPTGYTPGPWRHLPRAFGTHGVGTLRADDNWVLGARAEQLEADARLIALAHELADEVRRLSIENDRLRLRLNETRISADEHAGQTVSPPAGWRW